MSLALTLVFDWFGSSPEAERVKIPKIPDRHFNKDGNSACLFVKPQRWEVWPLGSGIGKFISGPVRDFFFSQAYYDLEGKWPYGDWRHGDDGIIDYFIKRLSVTDKKMLLAVVKLSLIGPPVRQTKCPCSKAISLLLLKIDY